MAVEGRDVDVMLCLSQGAASFVCETCTLSIPSAAADRSVLITELLEQTHDETSVPVPLSLQETIAWLSCAGRLGDTGTGTSAESDDAVLLLALKVSSELVFITF